MDYEELFSLFACYNTLRAILSIAVQLQMTMQQIDVKCTFLKGSLDFTIFMKQLEGFVSKGNGNPVCKLHKSLYALRQAPVIWYNLMNDVREYIKFEASKPDPSLYIRYGQCRAYILLSVDHYLII